MTINLNKLLKAVRLARRERRYHHMDSAAKDLSHQLVGSPFRLLFLGKLHYEFGMGDWDQYEAHKKRAEEHLQSSLERHEQSAREALDAGDEIGWLFAEQNISGLILPALGRYQEAMTRSLATCARAEAIAATKGISKANKKRALRVAMNTYFHQIRMVLTCERPPVSAPYFVRLWLERVKKNPVYLSVQDEVRAEVEAAEMFLRE